jgi:endonuclease YncB( thermonuclease family)
MSPCVYDGTPLTAENVRSGLRIRERHPDGQDRIIESVYDGDAIHVRGVVSGRGTRISWAKMRRYNIVSRTGA